MPLSIHLPIVNVNTKLWFCLFDYKTILKLKIFHIVHITLLTHSMYFLRGESTVRMIVAETTKVIWECLQKVYIT